MNDPATDCSASQRVRVTATAATLRLVAAAAAGGTAALGALLTALAHGSSHAVPIALSVAVAVPAAAVLARAFVPRGARQGHVSADGLAQSERRRQLAAASALPGLAALVVMTLVTIVVYAGFAVAAPLVSAALFTGLCAVTSLPLVHALSAKPFRGVTELGGESLIPPRVRLLLAVLGPLLAAPLFTALVAVRAPSLAAAAPAVLAGTAVLLMLAVASVLAWLDETVGHHKGANSLATEPPGADAGTGVVPGQDALPRPAELPATEEVERTPLASSAPPASLIENDVDTAKMPAWTDVAPFLRELFRALDDVAAAAQHATEHVHSLSQTAEDAVTGLHAAGERLDAVGACERKVEALVDDIREIADRSDTLALNASLEGVRAGEFGRGFGLIAIEIRRTAERIRSLIDELQQLANTLRREVQATAVANGRVRGLADALADRVTQLRRAAQQQVSGADDARTAAQRLEREPFVTPIA